jgi:hypothetical protein
MDLRGRLSREQLIQSQQLLNYQPFILADDIQTGAAYSWTTGDNSGRGFVRRKSECTPEEWAAFTGYAQRQRVLYDGWLQEIATRYPGGSLLDFATMNSYFPVKAQLLGMGRTTGVDGFCDSTRTDFLNQVLGTSAEFIHARYDPEKGSAPMPNGGRGRRWDVVCASAIMTHLPDPLQFLTFLASLSDKALFVFDRMMDTDAMLMSYEKPVSELVSHGRFPYVFNWGTRLSRGLVEFSLAQLGFANIVELPGDVDWLHYAPPTPDYLRTEHTARYKLGDEILVSGSKHVALLAMRRG